MKQLLVSAIALLMATAALGQDMSLTEIRGLAAQSRYDEAYRNLEVYLQERPADEQAQLLEGVLLTRLKRTDEALRAFQRLTEANPNLPEPHNNLAVLYAAKGRYEEARQSLLQAIALQPDYDTAHENLGDIYARLANLEYSKAHQINGSNTRARDKAETVVTLFDRIDRSYAASATARTQDEPTAMPASSASAAPVAVPASSSGADSKCYVAAGLKTTSDADTVTAWLEERGADATSGFRDEKEIVNYQVYVPPLASRSAAKELMGRMKQAGVTHLDIISKADLTNGISLGIYNKESATQRRVSQVREMGYAADYRPRIQARRVHFVDVRIANGALDEKAFGRAFPGFGIVPMPCP
jgi:hypothetical protein